MPPFRTWFLVAMCTATASSASAQGSTAFVRTLPGLYRVEVIVPEGRIAVNIPDDLAPGGLFTATVSRVPRSGGAARLNALAVEVPGLRPGPLPDRFEFLVDQSTPRSLRVEVRERESGALLGEANVPVRLSGPLLVDALPTVGLVGSPIRVRGAFDGNMANTAAVVSGTETVLLAESPRQLVLDTPDAPLGPGEIVVREQDRVTRGPFRVVGVTVTPSAATVASGARRTLDIQVAGLGELAAPLPFRVSVSGPVTVEGGREQRLDIRPANVQADGRWSFVRNVVAVDSGDMVVTTAVGTDLAGGAACTFAGAPVRIASALAGSGTLWQVAIETPIGEKRRLWIEGPRPTFRAGQWVTLRGCRQEDTGDGRASGWTIARDPRRSP